MRAKEMWFEIEGITKFEETMSEIKIYYLSEKEPIVIFLKNVKNIVVNDILSIKELQIINKQVEELGWNNER